MRDLFELDSDLIFLNHGSFGARPHEVKRAQWRWQEEMEANPVAFMSRRSGALLSQARERLGVYLGADPDEMAFVSNATTGVNIVAQSLDLRPGDEVLGTDLEYGACDATWRFVCERRGAVYRTVHIPLPLDRESVVDRLVAQVSPRTRLIFLSHITSATALILPVAPVCAAARERGVLTLVDGAHAPGQVPLNLRELGADFYTGNGHKWMCGPVGSAFLHARHEHHPMLHAPVVSWGYVAEAAAPRGASPHFDSYTGADTLQRRLQWQGTRDLSAWLALPAAIDFQERHGWPQVQSRCHRMAVQALHALRARWGLPAIGTDDDVGQMVAIPVPHTDAAALQRRLFDESRIEIPVTQHQGQTFVRLSVQAYNTEQDIQALLEAPALRG